MEVQETQHMFHSFLVDLELSKYSTFTNVFGQQRDSSVHAIYRGKLGQTCFSRTHQVLHFQTTEIEKRFLIGKGSTFLSSGFGGDPSEQKLGKGFALNTRLFLSCLTAASSSSYKTNFHVSFQFHKDQQLTLNRCNSSKIRIQKMKGKGVVPFFVLHTNFSLPLKLVAFPPIQSKTTRGKKHNMRILNNHLMV